MWKKVLVIICILTLALSLSACTNAEKIQNDEEAAEQIEEINQDIEDVSNTLEEIEQDLG